MPQECSYFVLFDKGVKDAFSRSTAQLVGVGSKHERVIVSQLDDRREHLIRLPPRSNGAVDERGKFQMERVLASDEAIRIVAWHIRRVYFAHLMNLSCPEKRVNTPKGRGRSLNAASASSPSRLVQLD
ncbi:hypothetical protein ACU8NU_10170 [Rhizobium leguminosarum]